MLSNKLEKELNKQLNAELYSAYLYLSMSAYLASNNLSGFSNWMKIQFEEEQAHAMKLYNYILDRGGNVTLSQIAQPTLNWDNVIQLFENVLQHEEAVTRMINKLVNLAIEENDHASVTMLQWFVNEQVEEEASVTDILEQLRIINGEGTGMLMLDRELKQRVFVPITQ